MKARSLVLAALALLLPATASAQLTWRENNALQSFFSGTPGYSTSGTTATVTYLNQTATNTGATSEHMGMYFAWNWLYDSQGSDTPLYWHNGVGAFVGPQVALTITRPGHTDRLVSLAEIVGDSWIGVPWAPGSETPIASDATWSVPYFDFGVLGAGQSINYDIQMTIAFSDPAVFADWDRGGSFWVAAQGISVVPEPSTFVLLGGALAGLVIVRRRRAS